MEKYRIIQHTYYEKCSEKKQYFTVQHLKRTWFGRKWKTIQEESWFGPMREYSGYVDIKFNTEVEAAFAIKNLHKGHIPYGWKEEVALEMKFGNEDR